MPDTRSPASWWDHVRLAGAFLTRLGFRPPEAEPPRPLAAAARAFPLVGALVGLIGGLVLWAALGLGLPPLAAALAALAATILTTGALHEDGLADLADGFGGGADRAQKLAIMRDSRIGTYGVLALLLTLGLRAAALAALAPAGLGLAALIAAGAVSRGLLPAIMHRLPLARADGLAVTAGRCDAASARTAALVGAAVAFVLAALAGRPGAALAGIAAAALAAAAVARLARRQIGGYTGDVLGAVQQAAETAFLLALAAA